MAKGNIRSMRFSDEILKMIESQAGDTFTAKFEALVTRCVWELPEKEKQLAEIQRQIENERQKLSRIQERSQRLENLMCKLEYTTARAKAEEERIIKELEQM